MNLVPVATALVQTLIHDGVLVSTLAPHPDDATLPAIFAGKKTDFSTVYPCLTYRLATVLPEGFSRPTQAEGGGPATIYNVAVELEGWSTTQGTLDTITARLTALLDGAALAFPGGRVFQSEMQICTPQMFDTAYRAWFSLYRFLFRTTQAS